MSDREDQEPRVVVRDRRRIDPTTGQVRAAEEVPEAAAAGDAAVGGVPASGATASGATASGAAGEQAGAPASPAEDLAALRAQLEERTHDLQRLSAEYANYRRRVDRDRELVALAARAQVAAELLTVLDDVARAEQHGDLTGPFKAVADRLVAAVEKLGVEPFGSEGEPFDPAVHEAVQHTTSSDVDGPTVSMVLRRGYRMGQRVLRPAMVAVTDREPGDEPGVLPAEGPRTEGPRTEGPRTEGP